MIYTSIRPLWPCIYHQISWKGQSVSIGIDTIPLEFQSPSQAYFTPFVSIKRSNIFGIEFLIQRNLYREETSRENLSTLLYMSKLYIWWIYLLSKTRTSGQWWKRNNTNIFSVIALAPFDDCFLRQFNSAIKQFTWINECNNIGK